MERKYLMDNFIFEDPADDPNRDDPEKVKRYDLMDMKEITSFVDDALNHCRPERYVENQFAWADAVVDHVRDMLDGEEYTKLITRTAWGIIKQREGIAKRRSTALFQSIGKAKGQLVIGHDTDAWMQFFVDKSHYPVQVNETDVVRFGALEDADLVDYEMHHKTIEDERREAADACSEGIIHTREFLASQPFTRLGDITG
jgi:hypothetical protein